jgi:hypothetical protein
MHRRCLGWYNNTNTFPWDSNWSGTREDTTKHAKSMLAMDRGRKAKLCKDVREHVVGGAPDELDGALLDEVADVVIFNVDVLGLRGCHVVGSHGDTTLVVLEGSCWASEGRNNCGKELAKEHIFLRGSNEGHVLSLGGRKSNTFLKFVAPGDKATGHHRDEAGARAAVDAVGKGGVLPNEKCCRDRCSEGEEVSLSARDVAKNAFGLFPMTRSRRGHGPAQQAYNS